MGARERGIQDGPAGIGVDFNERRPVASEVKIISHENPSRSEVAHSARRRPGKYRRAIGGMTNNGLDRLDNALHLDEFGRVKKYCDIGEKMGARLDQPAVKRGIARLLYQSRG
ncbi:hypothetical protein GCM10011349_13120 [Novosphingobium indicum]|uniref:Uncharacterized protein n=1 Tax=Novosphingobium indicum TaxID=462949 RepID=A0ABQ2JG77_9SPHN|nr:hypothetical protein GCM10011349_13120 [Novosphingobium indicum]